MRSCNKKRRREDVCDTPNLNFFAKTFETATVNDSSICGRNEARFDRLRSDPAPRELTRTKLSDTTVQTIFRFFERNEPFLTRTQTFNWDLDTAQRTEVRVSVHPFFDATNSEKTKSPSPKFEMEGVHAELKFSSQKKCRRPEIQNKEDISGRNKKRNGASFAVILLNRIFDATNAEKKLFVHSNSSNFKSIYANDGHFLSRFRSNSVLSPYIRNRVYAEEGISIDFQSLTQIRWSISLKIHSQ